MVSKFFYYNLLTIALKVFVNMNIFKNINQIMHKFFFKRNRICLCNQLLIINNDKFIFIFQDCVL